MEEVILPKLGSMLVGTVVEWLKKEGDDIKEGDVIEAFQEVEIKKKLK